MKGINRSEMKKNNARDQVSISKEVDVPFCVLSQKNAHIFPTQWCNSFVLKLLIPWCSRSNETLTVEVGFQLASSWQTKEQAVTPGSSNSESWVIDIYVVPYPHWDQQSIRTQGIRSPDSRMEYFGVRVISIALCTNLVVLSKSVVAQHNSTLSRSIQHL